MYPASPLAFLVVLGVLAATVFILVLPLKLAARAMSAGRSSTLWCLLALMGSSLLQMLGLALPGYGPLAAFFLSSVAFAAVLGTDILRGMGIAILHVLFAGLLLFLAFVSLGISLAGLAVC